jgi:hypothetical protein
LGLFHKSERGEGGIMNLKIIKTDKQYRSAMARIDQIFAARRVVRKRAAG